MTDKLTDKEVVKALECRVKDKCPECPYFHSYPCDKCRNMQTDALDLINRLQEKDETRHKVFETKCEELEIAKAEIERLKPFEDKIAEYKSHIRVEDMLVFANSLEEWLEFCDNLKAGAYKEFAENYGKLIWELKNEYLKKGNLAYASALVFSHTKLQNFLKELVGEDNESKN